MTACAVKNALLLAVSLGFGAFSARHGAAENRPQEGQSQSVQSDWEGESLPSGAVARMGSSRFRMTGTAQALIISSDGKLLAAIDLNQNLFVWDVTTGKRSQRYQEKPKVSGPFIGAAKGADEGS